MKLVARLVLFAFVGLFGWLFGGIVGAVIGGLLDAVVIHPDAQHAGITYMAGFIGGLIGLVAPLVWLGSHWDRRA